MDEEEGGGVAWRSRYPPGYVAGGVRLVRGRARLSIRVPGETPPGSYCLKLEPAPDSDGPAWAGAGAGVAAVYIPVTVL